MTEPNLSAEAQMIRSEFKSDEERKAFDRGYTIGRLHRECEEPTLFDKEINSNKGFKPAQ